MKCFNISLNFGGHDNLKESWLQSQCKLLWNHSNATISQHLLCRGYTTFCLWEAFSYFKIKSHNSWTFKTALRQAIPKLYKIVDIRFLGIVFFVLTVSYWSLQYVIGKVCYCSQQCNVIVTKCSSTVFGSFATSCLDINMSLV